MIAIIFLQSSSTNRFEIAYWSRRFGDDGLLLPIPLASAPQLIESLLTTADLRQ